MALSQSSAAHVRIRSSYLDEHRSIRARDSSLELVRQRVQDRVSAGVGYCGHVEKRRGTGEVGKDDDRRAVHG